LKNSEQPKYEECLYRPLLSVVGYGSGPVVRGNTHHGCPNFNQHYAISFRYHGSDTGSGNTGNAGGCTGRAGTSPLTVDVRTAGNSSSS
jgi:hypothetical protein